MLQRCSIMLGNQRIKRSFKPGNSVEGLIQVAQVDPHFEHGKVRPDVRPPKRQYLAEFHSRLSLHNVTSRLQQNGSSLPKTIYAANSQMVVSAGFAQPITTRITSKKRAELISLSQVPSKGGHLA